MSDDELSHIAGLVSKCNSILEIGTYCGRTTETLLRNSKAPVYSVDPLGRTTTIEPHPAQLSYLKKLAAEFIDRFTFFPCLSQELAQVWIKPIDFLLIDGDHATPAVYSDLQSFVPHLLPGGIVVLDDFNQPSVRAAWDEFDQAGRYQGHSHGKLGVRYIS